MTIIAPIIAPRDVGIGGRGFKLFLVSIVFTAVALLFVGFRLATRVKFGRLLGLDDYAIMLSMCFSIAMVVANCLSIDHGYGSPAKSLEAEDLQEALKMFWVLQVVYKFTINLTKTSILLLYRRIFERKPYRITIYVTLGYVVCYAVSSIFATIFQCTPIARTWNHDLQGHCINLTAFWYANAASNILSDLVILILPMPLISGLQLPRRQKYGLNFVFALGSFVCLTSILRMSTLDRSSKASDQTYGTMISTLWTTIEANTGIICACLPMLKLPISMIFPRIFARTSSNNISDPITDSLSGRTATNSRSNRRDSRPAPIHLATVLGGQPRSGRESQEQMIGKESNEVPMGSINKTTDFAVRFDELNSLTSDTCPTDQAVTIPPHTHMRRAHQL